MKVEEFAYEVRGYYVGCNYGLCMTLFPYIKALIIDKIKRHVRKHVELSMICKELEFFPTYSHLLPPSSTNVERLSATLERIVPELAHHVMNIPDHLPEQNLFRDIREAGKTVEDILDSNMFFHVCRMNIISHCEINDNEDRQTFLKMTSVLAVCAIKISYFCEHLDVDKSVFLYGIDHDTTISKLDYREYFAVNPKVKFQRGR